MTFPTKGSYPDLVATNNWKPETTVILKVPFSSVVLEFPASCIETPSKGDPEELSVIVPTKLPVPTNVWVIPSHSSLGSAWK